MTLDSDPRDTDAALTGRLDIDTLKREFGARRISFTRTLSART